MEPNQCIEPNASYAPPAPAADPGPVCSPENPGPYDAGPTNASSMPLDSQANVVPPGLAGPSGPDMSDAKGIALGVLGCAPGPLGQVSTLLSMNDTAASYDPNASPGDRAWSDAQLGLGVASLAGVEAAGPVGLVGSVGYATGKAAQVLGNQMYEGQRESDNARARAGSTTGELPPPYINNGPTGDPLNDNF